MRRLLLLIAPVLGLVLASCAPAGGPLATPAPPHRPRAEWATGWSDVPIDPAFRLGRLDNGMRYIIRRNATPKGTAIVRMEVEAGSLDEGPGERGFAHFVEHMAFNGSTNVPEGEMVKLLERDGLAFGADTNASTSFGETLYMLDLPRTDPALIDTALMLMRETASELTFSPEAVERERGVILSEKRDRNTWQLRNFISMAAFLYPGALYPQRLPIGTDETLKGATATALKAFWQREYVPEQTTLVVIGDFDPDAVEAAVRARFSSWARPAAAVIPQPDAGPVAVSDKGRTDVFVDPALSERVIVTRSAKWRNEADTLAQRRENVLRQIGYAIINRRLLRLTRDKSPPFRGASLSTGNVFRAARSTTLAVDTVDGKWRAGLFAATAEYRRALRDGFSADEVAEQVANLRAGLRNAVAAANTRSNRALGDVALGLVRDEFVPTTPQSGLERLEAMIPAITPETVLAAVKRDLVPLRKPLIRFAGRRAPDGGTKALRAAWVKAMDEQVSDAALPPPAAFGYTDFGPAGTIAADSAEPVLGIRTLRFANGVRLNLKRTTLDEGRLQVQVSVDGGNMLDTKANPLATEMVSAMAAGGLGKHSQDQLQSLLAGRSVGINLSATAETFVSLVTTTPADLTLQMQVLAALVSDPGYRLEGQTLYYNTMNTYFARLRATPGDALRNGQGGILSDKDPRFTLQPVEAYRALSFAKLKAAIADRLAIGAIEIGMVGDFDEQAAIKAVAATFGALPPREPTFGGYADQRQRPFTADLAPRVLRHDGPADQALLRLVWRTRDGSDADEAMALQLLDRLARNALTEGLRERLGKAYSPSASSDLSRVWTGYGTFSVTASANVADLAAVRTAIRTIIADLSGREPTADEMQRAREPLREGYAQLLKSNGGWMTLVDRAQTEPDRIDRQIGAEARLMAVTPARIRALAQRYLSSDKALEILVLPQGVDPPALKPGDAAK